MNDKTKLWYRKEERCPSRLKPRGFTAQDYMETWTKRQLEIAGYEFADSKIEDVSLCKSDDKLYLILTLEENMHDPIVGRDYPINHDASEAIMRIMDVVGESDLMSIKGKNIRIAYRRLTEPITVIGNIIDDKWFDYRSIGL